MSLQEASQKTEFTSPYHLKRSGNLVAALEGYADLYAEAKIQKNPFVCEQCFEQMFDISLLIYLWDNERFESIGKLESRLKSDLCKLLLAGEPYEDKMFESYIDNTWRKFSKGKNPFSVSRSSLITKAT